MTTPHVTELPRRPEPVGRDTFLGAPVLDVPPPAVARNVVALRPQDAAPRLRPPAPLAAA